MGKRKRSVLVSILFSVLSPGLGHMYTGHINLGIAFNLTYILLPFMFLEAGVGTTFTGLIIFAVISILFYIYVILHAVRLAKNDTEYILKRFNRTGYYILWLLIFYLLTTYLADKYRKDE